MRRVWKKAIRKQEFAPPKGMREGMRIRVAGAIVLIILAVVAVSAFLTLGLVEELKVKGFREDDGALVADLVDGLQNRVAGIHIGSIERLLEEKTSRKAAWANPASAPLNIGQFLTELGLNAVDRFCPKFLLILLKPRTRR